MSLLSRIAQKFDPKSESPTKEARPTTNLQDKKPEPDHKNICDNSSCVSVLNTIISTIHDGVIVIDKDNKIVLANSAAAEITGNKPDDMIGQTANKLVRSKDSLEVINTAVNNDKISIDSVVTLHDKSKEKMFEQMQIDFVSMASHEFRTPLTSIIGYLEVLSEEAKDKMSSEHKDFLERALSSSKQLSVLVNNLLNVSKVERNSMSVTIKPVDWEKMLSTAINNNKPQAVCRNILLSLHLPDQKMPQVLADDIRIIEVLNNLISNAVTYGKDGGKIDVDVKVNDDEIITSIKDDGVGIPKDAQEHLFTKFFRVPGALEQNSAGTGLGLYISKSIIDLHKGKIWVESKVGQGSTFYFSLPRADKTQTPTIASLNKLKV